MSFKAVFINICRWLINVFLKILYLKKRDRNLWVFGSWRGKRYADNSKILFEYVNNHLLDINAVWITKNPEVKQHILNLGYKCYLYNEKAAIKIRLNAGFTFYTNGMADIGVYDLSQGSKKIALWHGMPLKRLFFATNNLKKRQTSLIRKIQYLILKIYAPMHRDITIATSQTAKNFLIECFEVKPDTVLITGQPRNDTLFDKSFVANIREQLQHNTDELFVLYMPTWRESDKKGKPFLDKVISVLYEDTVFQNELINRGIKLYIKPHPNVVVNFESKGNIIVLKHSFNIDAQEILAVADTLITDYSSAFIDFALLEKPIHFYVPDLEDYSKDRLGVFLNFEDFAHSWFSDFGSLKKSILNESQSEYVGILNAKKVNEIYNDSDLVKGEYSSQTIKALTAFYS